MKLSSSRNQCGSCSQYFNSNSAFEKHRTGTYGVDRRCMTVEEMGSKLMEKNAQGYWITEPFNREEYALRQQTQTA